MDCNIGPINLHIVFLNQIRNHRHKLGTKSLDALGFSSQTWNIIAFRNPNWGLGVPICLDDEKCHDFMLAQVPGMSKRPLLGRYLVLFPA